MDMEMISGLAMETLRAVFFTSAPMLLAALIAGLAVSIFQAVTSINEMTLIFGIKIIAVMVSLVLFSSYILLYFDERYIAQ